MAAWARLSRPHQLSAHRLPQVKYDLKSLEHGNYISHRYLSWSRPKNLYNTQIYMVYKW